MFLLALLAATFGLVATCFVAWHKRFSQYSKFPQLTTSLFWGHLKIYNQITQSGPLDRDHGT